MQLGGIFGLYWCAGLFCLIGGISVPFVQLLYVLIMLSAPLVGVMLARHFEKQVHADAPVLYGRAYLFSLLMYLYATILLACVAYIYFQMFDHGSFIEANIAYMARPEVKAFMDAPDIKQQIQSVLTTTGFKDIPELLRSVTPIMISANIVDVNLLFAIVLSIPTAFLSQTKFNYLIKK